MMPNSVMEVHTHCGIGTKWDSSSYKTKKKKGAKGIYSNQPHTEDIAPNLKTGFKVFCPFTTVLEKKFFLQLHCFLLNFP
jgi:hypothetical protein